MKTFASSRASSRGWAEISISVAAAEFFSFSLSFLLKRMEVQCRSIFKGRTPILSACVIYIGAQGNIDFEARNWSQIGQARRFSNVCQGRCWFQKTSLEYWEWFVVRWLQCHKTERRAGGRRQKRSVVKGILTQSCAVIYRPGHKAISLSKHTASQRGAPHTFQPYCHCYDYFMTPVRHGVMPIIIDFRSPPHRALELISR